MKKSKFLGYTGKNRVVENVDDCNKNAKLLCSNEVDTAS